MGFFDGELRKDVLLLIFLFGNCDNRTKRCFGMLWSWHIVLALFLQLVLFYCFLFC
ncbi:hypothetical protein BCR33DRAFT_426819 [Rhizoclosmatium globosum]|uniref:Uncharacterized protein n=1 Tax=Rhizoclosmatium globosum TaxID=329046 RepID=A0A1Y2BVC6_9FUNG|nr:hypothetical protein BCR33DRAFT_426819 [Rhizoclosmatium globosum]|eukprot:ORY38624.1 hypothetical protein BCR33DRAFT_426819 [Rhizoclosmatium globosum]